jgi:phage tail-like protein
VTKYQNLSLRRGIADATELWQWHQDVVNGKIERRQIHIVLLDSLGNAKWRWVFEKAYPVKWSGTELNATSNAVFVEAVEFAHNGIKRG